MHLFSFTILFFSEWHYGVLSMYGGHMAFNHLIGLNQSNIIKIDELLDYPTGSNKTVFQSIQLHVFHGGGIFSKFEFAMGKYNNLSVAIELRNHSKYYCLYIALESKRLSRLNLTSLANVEASKKT